MKEAKIYKVLPLEGTEDGKIEFAVIAEPYGEGSKPVASIGVELEKGKIWKVHIPFNQIKDVRKALKDAKSAYKQYKKEAKKANKNTNKEAQKKDKNAKSKKQANATKN